MTTQTTTPIMDEHDRAAMERVVAERDVSLEAVVADVRPGFFQRFRQRVAPYVLVAGGLLSSLGVGARSSAEILLQPDGFVAGVADNAGAHGTYWSTEVCAVQDAADGVVVRFHPGNVVAPATTDNFIQLDVPRGQAVCVDNVLSGFDFVAPGALFYDWDGITPDQGYVFSRTWTVRPSGAPGAMGQGVPGVDLEDIVIGRPHVAPVGHDAAGFRTNLGITNGNAGTASFEVSLRGSGGAELATTTLELPGYSWFQYNNVFTALGIDERTHAYVRVVPLNPAQYEFTIYTSIIDNESGDPTFQAGQWRENDFSPLFVPAAAHLPGANNTFWTSDWDVINNGGENEAPFVSWFLQENRDNFPGGVAGHGESMPSEGLLLDDNLVQSVYGLQDVKGAIGTGANMDIWTRTSTNAGEGSFGAGLPGLRVDQHAVGGDEYSLLPGLRQSSATDAGSRTNIGLVNTGQTTIDAIIELYDGNGNLVNTITRTLQPWDMQQVNKAYGNTDITNGWAKVTSTATGDGQDTGIIAYGSIVDNQSGDGHVVLAKRVSPGVNYTVEDYVNYWMGEADENIHLANLEIKRLINGSDRTDPYVDSLAHAIYDHADPALPGDVNTTILGLQQDSDGNLDNGEFWGDYDPIVLAPDNQLLRKYKEPDGRTNNFYVTTEGVDAIRDVFRTFLIDHVGNYPDLYDYSSTTPPEDALGGRGPTWWSADENPFFEP